MTQPGILEIDGETWLKATDVIAYLLECADWADTNIPGPGYTSLALRTCAEKLSAAMGQGT